MNLQRLALTLALAALVSPLAAKPRPAQGPKGGDVFKLLETAQVRPDETIDGNVVVFGSHAIIEGKVTQDVVVIGGRAYVTGQVGGDLVVIGPGADLGAQSEVGRDFVAIGTMVRRAAGSKVHGKTVTLHGLKLLAVMASIASLLAFGAMWVKLFSVVGWLLLAAVGGALLSRPLSESADVLRRRPIASLLIGLLFWPALAFLFAALVVSLLGLPLTPILAIGAGLVCLWGYLSAGQRLGQALVPGAETAWLPCFVGVGVLQIAGWLPFGRTLEMLALMFGIGATMLWLPRKLRSGRA